jgi:hypothetical protein
MRLCDSFDALPFDPKRLPIQTTHATSIALVAELPTSDAATPECLAGAAARS